MINPATQQTTITPNGMVTTPHYLASQAALEILQQGEMLLKLLFFCYNLNSGLSPHE
jgi:hypothetical protein